MALSTSQQVSVLNTVANNAWIMGFQQNVLGATFASSGLLTWLPSVLYDPQPNMLNFATGINPAILGALVSSVAAVNPPTYSTNFVLSGTQSLLVGNPGPLPNVYSGFQTAVFRTQTTSSYTYTFTYLCDTTTPIFDYAIFEFTPSGVYNGNTGSSISSATSGTWTTKTVTFTPNAGTTQCAFIILNQQNGSNVYLDSLYVYPTPGPPGTIAAGSSYGLLAGTTTGQTTMANNTQLTFPGLGATLSGGMSYSSGVFTVPATGVYQCSYAVELTTFSVGTGVVPYLYFNPGGGNSTELGGVTGSYVPAATNPALSGSALIAGAANSTVGVFLQITAGTCSTIGVSSFSVVRMA